MIGYLLELFDLGINFGLNEVEGLGDALVLSGNGVGLVEGVGSQEADEEGSEDDGLHCTIKLNVN